MEITLQGSLRAFKLPDILTFLDLSRKSGLLEMSSRGKIAQVFFDAGAVVFASTNQDHLRLSSILLKAKKITQEDCARVEARMMNGGPKFGTLALAERVLTTEDLEDFLKIQVSEILYDCFVWDAGEFTLSDGAVLPDHAVTISVDISNLIMEGARRIDEWDQCLNLLPDDSIIFRVAPNPETQERITLSLNEWKILFLINGEKSLAQLASELGGEPLETYRIIYGLQANKLIEQVSLRPFSSTLSQRLESGPPLPAATIESPPPPEDDTSLLVSPRATLSYRDVVRVTVAKLTLRKSDDDLVTYPLVDQEYLIGRQQDNEIRLTDSSVSSFHARVFRVPEGYMLEDLKSRNGSVVNGARVEQRLLQDNDTIRLGKSVLIYNIIHEAKPVPIATLADQLLEGEG